MHWLPLVAMVIASALPFPQSPVARLVAATIEPGRNNNSTSVSKAENNMPTNLSMTNDSHGAHNDNSLNNEEAKNKTLNTPMHSSVSKLPDRVSAGRRDQENALPEELSINKTIEQDLTDSAAADQASRLYTPVEYKSKTNPDEKVSLRSNDVLENSHLANHQQKSSTGAETIHQARNTLGNASPGGSVKSSPAQEHLEGASKTKSSPEEDTTEQNGETPSYEMGNVGLWEEDQLLLLDAHPRVLFSPALSPPKHPPLLLMLELGLQAENSEESDVSRDSAPPGGPESYRNLLLGLSNSDNRSSTQKFKSGVRHKRQVAHSFQGREHSVCEAENKWTTGKKTAVDDRSKTVTILEEIQTQTGPLKQYFFETRCRKPSQRGEGQGVEGAGCLGVDKKHWTSRCQTKQSYVRALTSDDNMRVGWRWIRIDGGCVCVLLTRGSYHTEKKLERGREARRYR